MTTAERLRRLGAFREYLQIRWQGLDHLYVLGITEQRVTFFDQQVRALNLACALTHDELPEAEKPPAGERIAVIGGGIAGVTLALGLARRGREVTLFEKRHRVLDLQSGCSHRRVHPHLYDWPNEGWNDDRAGLPLLDWQADEARKVCDHLRADFEREARAMGQRIQLHTEVNQIILRPTGQDRTPIEVGYLPPSPPDRCGVRRTPHFGGVVIAVGFGIEPDVGSFGSYWSGDPLPNLEPGTRLMVSGNGDGGLTDVLRSKLEDCDHDRLEVLASHSSLEGVRSELAEGPAAELSDNTKRSLEGFIKQLRIRPHVEVLLNHSGSDPVGSTASTLNRFLVKCLVDQGYVGTVRGHLRKSGRSWPPRRIKSAANRPQYVVTIDRKNEQVSKKSQDYQLDVLIIRHGPKSAIEALSPEISALVTAKRDEKRFKPATRQSFRQPLWGPETFLGGRAPEPATATTAHFARTMLIGGVVDDDDDGNAIMSAAAKMGTLLAEGGTSLVACSPFDGSVDTAAARAYAEAGGRLIDLHVPHCETGWQVDDALTAFKRTIGQYETVLRVWRHDGPTEDVPRASWKPYWAIAQDIAYESCDMVMALGGRTDGTARPLLARVERERRPLLPLPAFGGAAKLVFDGIQSALRDSILCTLDDLREVPDNLVEIGNGLWNPGVETRGAEIETIFVSRSRHDARFAQELVRPLKPVKVVVGEVQQPATRDVLLQIEARMKSADAILILWSSDFAMSDFCRNELDFAEKRNCEAGTPVWIVELDGTQGLGHRLRGKFGRGQALTLEALVQVVKRLLPSA